MRVSRSAACLICAAALAAAGPKPDLDLPADSELLPVLRRAQARSDSLYPAQAFPQRYSDLERWLAARPLRPADDYALDHGLPARRREAVAWASPDSANSFYLSPRAEAGYAYHGQGDSTDNALLGGVGMILYGRFGSHLSFYSRGMAYTEATDRAQFTHQFNPDFGETYSVEKGSGDSLLSDRSFNRYECYVLADFPGLRLKAGRDRVHTGPGYFSSLTAQRGTPPYWLAEARIDFAPWLQVDNLLLAMTDTDHALRKYANLHRFEFRPLASLMVAFQDIVIYQDRDPDWRYALPLVPLTFTESDQGGLDNSAMGFDFLYGGVRNLSVWGELFIDDLLGPGSFFDDFWENRWAALAGFQAVSPLPWLDADLVVEWSHAEPWTYIGRKDRTSFKHFNVPSASRLGPDARTWDVQVSWRPLRWLEARSHWEGLDKGLGRPGMLGVVHDDAIDGTSKEFLGGPTLSRDLFTQELRLIWSLGISGRVAWTHEAGDLHAEAFAAGVTALW